MPVDPSLVGRTYPPSRPYEVGREKIREFADALGDPHPAYRDPEAAKGAIIATTKTLARELGPFRINVNAVAPGFVETRLTAPKSDDSDLGVPEALRNMAVALISVGRAGQPEDIANVHAFLVSPDADFVSGVTIPVTGGQFGGMG